MEAQTAKQRIKYYNARVGGKHVPAGICRRQSRRHTFRKYWANVCASRSRLRDSLESTMPYENRFIRAELPTAEQANSPRNE